MKFNKLCGLIVLASAFVLAPRAKADSITFVSHVGNDYTYNLTLDNHLTFFIPGGFTLSGLSGVTNASLSGELDRIFDIVFQNATTVTVGTLFNASYNFRDIPYSIGTLTLTSLASPGLTDFSILDSHGIFLGTVTGPDVAPIPEPSSLMLLGSGIFGLAAVVRRKLTA